MHFINTIKTESQDFRQEFVHDESDVFNFVNYGKHFQNFVNGDSGGFHQEEVPNYTDYYYYHQNGQSIIWNCPSFTNNNAERSNPIFENSSVFLQDDQTGIHTLTFLI